MENKYIAVIAIIVTWVVMIATFCYLDSVLIESQYPDGVEEESVEEEGVEEPQESKSDYVFVAGDYQYSFTASVDYCLTNKYVQLRYVINESEYLEVSYSGILTWFKDGTTSVYVDNWRIENTAVNEKK